MYYTYNRILDECYSLLHCCIVYLRYRVCVCAFIFISETQNNNYNEGQDKRILQINCCFSSAHLFISPSPSLIIIIKKKNEATARNEHKTGHELLLYYSLNYFERQSSIKLIFSHFSVYNGVQW